jgi:hypothetical protein
LLAHHKRHVVRREHAAVVREQGQVLGADLAVGGEDDAHIGLLLDHRQVPGADVDRQEVLEAQPVGTLEPQQAIGAPRALRRPDRTSSEASPSSPESVVTPRFRAASPSIAKPFEFSNGVGGSATNPSLSNSARACA